MKTLIFSGTHERHLFIHSEVIKQADNVLMIVMQREELIPSPPENINEHDKQNFVRHFANRHEVEKKAYSQISLEQDFSSVEKVFVTPKELNTKLLAKRVQDFDADFCFIFGPDLILSPVIDVLPRNRVNLHLGLSPWYKGGATLFWPFYFLQPQFAGITFHQITEKPDAGEIIHQCTPQLELGDKIHDVGVKCVTQAKLQIGSLMQHFKSFGDFEGEVQRESGRVWRGTDFHPSQLRVIYDLYDDNIVDAYLAGELEQKTPKLVSCLS